MDDAAGEAHTKDWEMNVDKYGKSHNVQYSLRDEDLTYNPNNETVGENVLIRGFDVNNKSTDFIRSVRSGMWQITLAAQITSVLCLNLLNKLTFL